MNTHEQTHLIRYVNGGHSVRDARLTHVKRFPNLAGDSINIVGVVASPIAMPVIEHVYFAECARFGIQITRGTTGGRIGDSTFSGACAIGSEGDGGISGLTIDHLEFQAPAVPAGRAVAMNIQRMTDLTIDHVRLHGRSILLYLCDRVTLQHSAVDGLVALTPGDFVSALTISTMAHDVLVTDVRLEQTTAASAPVIMISPIRSNYPSSLSRISVVYSSLLQATPSPVVMAQGVDGLSLTSSAIALHASSAVIAAGPSIAVPPAVSMPSLNIVQNGNTLTILP